MVFVSFAVRCAIIFGRLIALDFGRFSRMHPDTGEAKKRISDQVSS